MFNTAQVLTLGSVDIFYFLEEKIIFGHFSYFLRPAFGRGSLNQPYSLEYSNAALEEWPSRKMLLCLPTMSQLPLPLLATPAGKLNPPLVICFYGRWEKGAVVLW